MLKLFILKKLPLPHLPMITPFFGENRGISTLFQKIPTNEYKGIFAIVSSACEADYLLIPHNWNYIKHNEEYIRACELESQKSGKKIIVFEYSDSHEPVVLKNSIVFRSSQYKSLRRKNEIIMPAYVEDLGKNGIITRHTSAKPVVGFVGRSGFISLKDRLRYAIKFILKRGVFRDGRYFRRKAMEVCRKSDKVISNFIERKAYSAHAKTIEKDPSSARKEYINNMNESDLILAPKGDGNYSLRFYEALSLGRLPIIIDTEMLFPLQDEIRYEEISLSCSISELPIIDQKIASFYAKLSKTDFEIRQNAARDIFSRSLYMPQFLRKTLSKDYLRRYEA
jgi:hypothetical protein